MQSLSDIAMVDWL